MVIDLDKCTGCQACVVACRQENNIPFIGEKEAKLGRAKFWMNLIHETKGPILMLRCGSHPCPACTAITLRAQRFAL
jgi:molybdopterin-containing oxidoreductase family iron-sulfur binding subunit